MSFLESRMKLPHSNASWKRFLS